MLGEFDGFHLGHRHLVQAAVDVVRRDHLPLAAVVLTDSGSTDQLLDVEERCWTLLASGAASAFAITNDPRAAGERATTLVDEIIERLHPAVVVLACLPDISEPARHPDLRAALRGRSIDIIEVERLTDPDGSPITSARIRDALRTGQVAAANDWLGRPFTLGGTVVHGSGLGHTIGFPTANLSLTPTRLVPMRGVYAAFVDLEDGTRHRAAVNIGVRPTVEADGQLLVEAHLLDFDADLYDTHIAVVFRRWLRHEQRFDSLDALVQQLGDDTRRAAIVLRH
ncbi:MAG: bifunctional riboflavin kinase/FMN adenylyltransferase [Acidimicrobiales bacterium]|nr:bifunctional riboflavin kinase/FMN adenylyltransferase [Acidimicrobiales bacterium]